MANRNEGLTYVDNLDGLGGPMVVPGLFQAGSTAAIYEGMLLYHDGTRFVPLTADQSMAGVVAIAAQRVESGDLAGYRPIIVPRPGDRFKFTLLSTDSQAPALTTAVYVSNSNSDSFTVTTTAGTNVLGAVAGFAHYPQFQGRQADDASFDRGSTISNLESDAHGGEVLITIERSNSYYSAICRA